MAPEFEVVGYHNQNQILVFISPGFLYVHVVEWWSVLFSKGVL